LDDARRRDLDDAEVAVADAIEHLRVLRVPPSVPRVSMRVLTLPHKSTQSTQCEYSGYPLPRLLSRTLSSPCTAVHARACLRSCVCLRVRVWVCIVAACASVRACPVREMHSFVCVGTLSPTGEHRCGRRCGRRTAVTRPRARMRCTPASSAAIRTTCVTCARAHAPTHCAGCTQTRARIAACARREQTNTHTGETNAHRRGGPCVRGDAFDADNSRFDTNNRRSLRRASSAMNRRVGHSRSGYSQYSGSAP
jgi:hypothetical protein